MTYVIAAPCVADYSCVEVCPVDCISPTPDDDAFDGTDQLFIDPGRCIACAACMEACPVDAIFDEAALPPEWRRYARANADFFANVANDV